MICSDDVLLKKPIKLDELLACVERVERRSHPEAQFLEEHQNLLCTGGASGVGTIPAGPARDIHASVASVMSNLQSLENFWNTIQHYLRESHPEDPSEQKRLDLILGEMPGLLFGMDKELERIAHMVRDGDVLAPERQIPMDKDPGNV